MMFSKLLENHVLANLTLLLVLSIGFLSYSQLPREQDPTVNFNWVDVTTTWPGASAQDMEKLVTDPLEESIESLQDVHFVISTSREGYSNLVIRFREIDPHTFDKRLADLRRQIQNKANAELPDEVDDPIFSEITSANAFPTAVLVVKGRADDEMLRASAQLVKEDLERTAGVDRVFALGLHEPELQIRFDPEKLEGLGIPPTTLADSMRSWFRDVPAGSLPVGDQQWLVRLNGKISDPDELARLPLIDVPGEIPINTVARIERDRSKAQQKVRMNGAPGVLLAVNKRAHINTLDLLAGIRAYIDKKNRSLAASGLEIALVDDQTPRTKKALDVMEHNASLGLLLVMSTVWFFLGWRIAIFVGIGIPFTLAGAFWVLSGLDYTVNVAVLLGVVIALGMLVDDSVVVVEAIYDKLRSGIPVLQGTIAGVGEVAIPVATSVLTTVAAFLPLTLMPGIMGQFMRVIPILVSVMLLVSLVEALWILPSHVASGHQGLIRKSSAQRLRERLSHRLRVAYGKLIIALLRRPKRALAVLILLIGGAIAAIAGGTVRVEFFATDPIPLFYVNVEMPGSTRLDETLRQTERVEATVRAGIRPQELRAMASYAGQMFTETGPLLGEQYGQVIVSLHSPAEGIRGVEDIVDSLRDRVLSLPGPAELSFLRLLGGPPSSKPINIKVRGKDYQELREATDALRRVLEQQPGITDISDDDSTGKPALSLRLNADAIKRAGLEPASVARNIRLLVDGEEIADFQHQGEKISVRVQADRKDSFDAYSVLEERIALSTGKPIAVARLVDTVPELGRDNIRHYNFRLTITLEADLDKAISDTVTTNRNVQQAWQTIAERFPGVDLVMSGELEDIQESLDSMKRLFWLGMGLVYLILGTQFRSYWQPFLVLSTIPMAFTGVVAGLVVTGQPLSLFTLYGVIALGGIAINAAIVMIVAANQRRSLGMSTAHATVYAARRRLIPIIITSATTIAGLFSLAVGLGGKSLLWGPVASVIVWGLAFSTVLSLLFMPLMYGLFHRSRQRTNSSPATA